MGDKVNLRWWEIDQIEKKQDLSEEIFKDRDLTGVNFSRKNLKKAILTCCTLINANFSGSDLQFARLNAANLKNANFQNADLRGTNLRGSSLIGANFLGANLRGTSFSGARFDKTTQFPEILQCSIDKYQSKYVTKHSDGTFTFL